ncbi:hypothetical protein YC2023_097855 [Brassica napus]
MMIKKSLNTYKSTSTSSTPSLYTQTKHTTINNRLPDTNETATENLNLMLTYHHIDHPNSTFLIQKTNKYKVNLLRDNDNIFTNDLQVALTIRDYNHNATARVDVDLIITDLADTNRTPTTNEENDICIICFENYNNVTNISTLTCTHNTNYTTHYNKLSSQHHLNQKT